MDAFVRAATLKNYTEVAQSLGLNPSEMLRGVGLTPVMLNDPECMLPLEAALKLLESSAARSSCPTFGLRMAEARRLVGSRRHQLAVQSSAHTARHAAHQYRVSTPAQPDAGHEPGNAWETRC